MLLLCFDFIAVATLVKVYVSKHVKVFCPRSHVPCHEWLIACNRAPLCLTMTTDRHRKQAVVPTVHVISGLPWAFVFVCLVKSHENIQQI